MQPMAHRESYGVDAPKAVWLLGIFGFIFLTCRFVPARLPGAAVAHAVWPTSISLLAGCAWMLASSLWLKKRVMRSLLNQRNWRGDENVLDVGCGRGLVTIEAARRVPRGRMYGIDIWQPNDLSGNSPAAVHDNAVAAGVDSRLTIETGDARDLPYPEETFDVVTSMTALHNIPTADAGSRLFQNCGVYSGPAVRSSSSISDTREHISNTYAISAPSRSPSQARSCSGDLSAGV